jgi:hypothetical protein
MVIQLQQLAKVLPPGENISVEMVDGIFVASASRKTTAVLADEDIPDEEFEVPDSVSSDEDCPETHIEADPEERIEGGLACPDVQVTSLEDHAFLRRQEDAEQQVEVNVASARPQVIQAEDHEALDITVMSEHLPSSLAQYSSLPALPSNVAPEDLSSCMDLNLSCASCTEQDQEARGMGLSLPETVDKASEESPVSADTFNWNDSPRPPIHKASSDATQALADDSDSRVPRLEGACGSGKEGGKCVDADELIKSLLAGTGESAKGSDVAFEACRPEASEAKAQKHYKPWGIELDTWAAGIPKARTSLDAWADEELINFSVAV